MSTEHYIGWGLLAGMIAIVGSLLISAAIIGYDDYHYRSAKPRPCLYLHPALGLSHCPAFVHRRIMGGQRAQ